MPYQYLSLFLSLFSTFLIDYGLVLILVQMSGDELTSLGKTVFTQILLQWLTYSLKSED